MGFIINPNFNKMTRNELISFLKFVYFNKREQLETDLILYLVVLKEQGVK